MTGEERFDQIERRLSNLEDGTFINRNCNGGMLSSVNFINLAIVEDVEKQKDHFRNRDETWQKDDITISKTSK